MASILKRRFWFSFSLLFTLGFVFFITGLSPADELKPIQKINFVTWTKAQVPARYEQALIAADTWKKLGLDVWVEPLNFPNPNMERSFGTRDFDVYAMGVDSTLERLDPDFLLYMPFHSSNAGPKGWNMAGFVDSNYDRLVEAQRAEYDMEKRRAIVHQCQEFLYRENPLVIVLHQNALAAYNKEDFRDPVIPKGAAFLDPLPFFTIKPTGNRKIFRVGSVAADIKTLNPLLTAESETVIYSNLMYDMLLRIGPDGKPQLWVAKEVKPIDQKTIEVSIREDLKFHDGKPLTAEDVKFTFDFMIKHKAVYYRTVLGPVESVDMVNRYKVRFHLKEPYAPFVTLTLAMVPLLPKHIWEKIENPTEYRNEPLIGSGPFKFDYWRKGQEIKMSRFSEHFRPPYVDGLLFIFGSLEAANMGLIKKESDLCYRVLLPHQMETFKNYSHIQQ